jgi:hypothetical protein
MDTGALSPGVKRQEREADHSLSASAEVHSPIRLHGVVLKFVEHRDNFTVITYFLVTGKETLSRSIHCQKIITVADRTKYSLDSRVLLSVSAEKALISARTRPSQSKLPGKGTRDVCMQQPGKLHSYSTLAVLRSRSTLLGQFPYSVS